jgi:hypothetical protein
MESDTRDSIYILLIVGFFLVLLLGWTGWRVVDKECYNKIVLQVCGDRRSSYLEEGNNLFVKSRFSCCETNNDTRLITYNCDSYRFNEEDNNQCSTKYKWYHKVDG